MRRPALTSLAVAPPLAALALLAGCGGGGAPVRSPGSTPPPRPARPNPARPNPAHAVPTRPAPARHGPPPAPQIQALPGVAGVIGADRDDLVRQFGAPRLDVWEGDARKLQFAGTACVLDVYLYPPAAGREAQATFVDARRASDGQDVDRTACIGALRRPAAGAGVTRP